MEYVKTNFSDNQNSGQTSGEGMKSNAKRPITIRAFAYCYIVLGIVVLFCILLGSFESSSTEERIYAKGVNIFFEQLLCIVMGGQLIGHIFVAQNMLHSTDTEAHLKQAASQVIIQRNAAIGFVVLDLLKPIFLVQICWFDIVFDCGLVFMCFNLQNKIRALTKSRKTNQKINSSH